MKSFHQSLFIKTSITLLLIFAAGGCSAPYKPSQQVQQLTSSMTTLDARGFLQNKLTPHNGFGICLGNDWTAADIPELNVTEHQITLNALERGRLASTDFGGTLRTFQITGTGLIVSHTYEQIPITKSLKLDDFQKVTIHETSFNRICGSWLDGDFVFRFELSTGDWFEAVVHKAEYNKFIASILLLVPTAEVYQ